METVPDVAYSYQAVKERVFVPRQVTENRTTTVVKYTPIQSYQLQLQNVPGLNPFASPRQVWQYVPIVQYQPNYEQVTQPVTYVKYEEQEVERQIPVLAATSKQVPRYVDRPLGPGPNGGNTLAGAALNNFNNPNFNNPNVIQNAAQIAQANRNTSRFPTRPIDYPTNYNYRGFPNRNLVAQAPAPYYPSPANAPGNNPNNPMLANAGASNIPPPSNISSAVPLRPNMLPEPNSMAGYNGYPAGAYPAGSNPSYSSTPYPGNPYQANPYVNTASRPLFNLPSFVTGTGSLFGNSLFSSNRGTNYVASNIPVSQPYLWGSGNTNGPYFRPNSSPYTTQPPTWGVTPSNSYRDPMQGGMPATVLR